MKSRTTFTDAPPSRNLFTCGVFGRGDEDHLIGTLRALGLALDEENGTGTVIREAGGGLSLEARGDGVRGYLLAEDGEEAELQDIKRLVLACALPDQEVRFSGSCQLGPDTLLVISSRAVHDGRVVRWTSTRTVVGSHGEARTVRDRDLWENGKLRD